MHKMKPLNTVNCLVSRESASLYWKFELVSIVELNIILTR